MSFQWAGITPAEYFGDRTGSRLADAMDATHWTFLTIPNSYPEGAGLRRLHLRLFAKCRILLLDLMANIDALDPAYTVNANSKDEWYVCTKDELQQIDPLAYDLLNTQGFKLHESLAVHRGPSGRETHLPLKNQQKKSPNKMRRVFQF